MLMSLNQPGRLLGQAAAQGNRAERCAANTVGTFLHGGGDLCHLLINEVDGFANLSTGACVPMPAE